MAENKKNGCISWIIIFVIFGILGNAIDKCSDSSSDTEGLTKLEKKEYNIALEAYNKIMDYCLDNYTEKRNGSQTGYVFGYSKFKYNFSEQTIDVTSSALQYIATEKGHLSKFSVKESCGFNNSENYYPVSIQGWWQPEGCGGGKLNIALSKDNILNVYIFREDNSKHWVEYTLTSPKYILDVFNDARQKVAKLKKTDFTPIKFITNNSQKNINKNNDVFSFLSTVYPNNKEAGDGNPNRADYVTERFKEYSEKECDYDPIYCTQDCYAANVTPEPQFSVFTSFPDAYQIKWKRYEQEEEVSNIVIVVKTNGKYLIDNVLNIIDNKPVLLFDYTKPAQPFWE